MLDTITHRLWVYGIRLTAGLLDPPDPGTGTAPPGIGAKLITVMEWFAWGAGGLCVIGIFAAGAKMAVSRQRGEDVQLSALGWTLFGCALVGSAYTIVSVLTGVARETE